MAKAKTIVSQIGEAEWKVTKIYKNGKKEQRLVKDPIDIWIIGNTGMRNPWRIPGGFKVYVESNQVGHIRKPQDQKAFKKILAAAGEIGGDPNKDKDASITRKYRLMFSKYGFIYPEVTVKDGFQQEDLGKVDELTPAGRAFYHADTLQAKQECFLRGLIVPMEELDAQTAYSPLLWVLQIMFKLYEVTGDYKINFIEFAVCVQTSTPKHDPEKVVSHILEIRNAREESENKKKFDNLLIHAAWERYFKEEKNFRDYGDMNMRYLISTGILKRSGRGLTLVSEYKSLAKELSRNAVSTTSRKERYLTLCNGAPLPTDQSEIARQVLKDLITELNIHNIAYTLPDIPLDTPQNINIVRHSLKREIDQYKEEVFARNQYEKWEEIYEYMQLLITNNGKEKEIDDDTVIKVPRSEASAYLEWVLWRAFLAIDHTMNKPYEARRFHIDQDYLPVGTAPGSGPDMIFEFKDYIIAVEVTLSTSSRQEAMEGEPVRRHVADLMQQYEKPVYGLFIANRIDSNTAETFRIGAWYTREDKRLDLHIVPFTLTQFSAFFKSIFISNRAVPQEIVSLMNRCESYRRTCEAPAWKQAIEQVVQASLHNS